MEQFFTIWNILHILTGKLSFGIPESYWKTHDYVYVFVISILVIVGIIKVVQIINKKRIKVNNS
jgi:hypothetical protein